MFIVTKEIDSENISKLCRTCLREDGDKMVCLFVGPAGSSLAAKLRSLSCLEVSNTSCLLSLQVCENILVCILDTCRSGKEMVYQRKCAIVVSPEQNRLFYTENNAVQQTELCDRQR